MTTLKMSIKDMIIDSVNKLNDDYHPLTELEILVKNECVKYTTNILFSKDNLYKHINKMLVDNEVFPIKLIFSGNSHVYVNKKILLKMDFFKNMFGSYGVSHKLILDIKVDKKYDNEKFFRIIVESLEYNMINTDFNFDEMLEMIFIVDYLGVEYDKKTNICMITKMVDYICDDNIEKHKININTIISIYNALTNHISNCDKKHPIYKLLWDNLEKSDANTILTSQFFQEQILKTDEGVDYVFKNKYVPYYYDCCELIFGKSCIIRDLINVNTIESYEMLVKIVNKYGCKYEIISNIDNITNLILKCDLSKFHFDILLCLEMKFETIDKVNAMVKNQFASNFQPDMHKQIIKFVTLHNKNEKGIENKKDVYKNAQNYGNKIIVIESLVPFVFYDVKRVVEVNGVDIESKIYNINVITESTLFIDFNTKLYYNHNNILKTLTLTRIFQSYIVNRESKTLECNGIISGHEKNKQTYNLIFEEEIVELFHGSRLYIKV